MWFSDRDYAELGNLIKCNPAIKTAADHTALFQALHEGRLDIIATDHAPHTWEEKQVNIQNIYRYNSIFTSLKSNITDVTQL